MKEKITLNELMQTIAKIKSFRRLPYEIEKFIVLCKEKRIKSKEILHYLKLLGYPLSKNQLEHQYFRVIKADDEKYQKILSELKKDKLI
jgi:hypothetical protein